MKALTTYVLKFIIGATTSAGSQAPPSAYDLVNFAHVQSSPYISVEELENIGACSLAFSMEGVPFDADPTWGTTAWRTAIKALIGNFDLSFTRHCYYDGAWHSGVQICPTDYVPVFAVTLDNRPNILQAFSVASNPTSMLDLGCYVTAVQVETQALKVPALGSEQRFEIFLSENVTPGTELRIKSGDRLARISEDGGSLVLMGPHDPAVELTILYPGAKAVPILGLLVSGDRPGIIFDWDGNGGFTKRNPEAVMASEPESVVIERILEESCPDDHPVERAFFRAVHNAGAGPCANNYRKILIKRAEAIESTNALANVRCVSPEDDILAAMMKAADKLIAAGTPVDAAMYLFASGGLRCDRAGLFEPDSGLHYLWAEVCMDGYQAPFGHDKAYWEALIRACVLSEEVFEVCYPKQVSRAKLDASVAYDLNHAALPSLADLRDKYGKKMPLKAVVERHNENVKRFLAKGQDR